MYKINKVDRETKTIRIITKVVNIMIYIILIPILIYNFTLICKSFVNPNEIPDFFGYKNFIIGSESMEPTLNVNDVIFVKEVPQSEIRVNDIISFKYNDIIITHRITRIIDTKENRQYKTKGDQSDIEDEVTVNYEQIEGKYQFSVPGFGKILNVLQSKTAIIIVIIMLGLNYLNYSRLEKRRDFRSEKRKQYEELKNEK